MMIFREGDWRLEIRGQVSLKQRIKKIEVQDLEVRYRSNIRQSLNHENQGSESRFKIIKSQ